MASPIIEAARSLTVLKEGPFHTLIELCHRASMYGIARVSYRHLIPKCHCAKRTIQRHIDLFVELGLVKKIVTKTRKKVLVNGRVEWRLWNEINEYRILFLYKKPDRTQAPIDKVTPKFPYQERRGENASASDGREKNQSLREQISKLEFGLRALYTPGTIGYVSTEAELERLRGLVRVPTTPADGVVGSDRR